MSATLLRLVHSSEWSTWRRHRLGREVRTALACTGAVWERDGIEAATAVLANHWQAIESRYPSDWVDVATEGGWL